MVPLAGFEARAHVKVLFRSFELDPSAPSERDTRETQAERIAKKYGTSASEAQRMIERVVQTAMEAGITYDVARSRPGNSFLAHRLLHLAQARGRQAEAAERFFRGYFSEGRAIGRPEVAAALAREAGLDADEIEGLVQGDLYVDAVRADQREAKELGVTGVPFFLLGRRYAVAGAQPTELLGRALQQTWDELQQ